MEQIATQGEEGLEFRLTVWTGRGTHWRARVIAADATEVEFANPFELARYVAWPGLPAAKERGKGLR
jgi:hypothetical protein